MEPGLGNPHSALGLPRPADDHARVRSRLALAPIDPSDLHGFEREDDEGVKRGFEAVTPD